MAKLLEYYSSNTKMQSKAWTTFSNILIYFMLSYSVVFIKKDTFIKPPQLMSSWETYEFLKKVILKKSSEQLHRTKNKVLHYGFLQ